MRDRPFVQIYSGQLVIDTLHLDVRAIGAYSLLLFAVWNGDGKLPEEEEKLARIARVSVEEWREIWPDLQPFFHEVGGRLTSRHVKKWFSKVYVFGRVPLSAALRNSIYDRDGAICRYCGATEGPFHVDHVIPVAKGGSDEPDNLVIACMGCNLSKGAKTLEEWRR